MFSTSHTEPVAVVRSQSGATNMPFIFIFEYYPRLFAEDVLRYMPITTSIVLQIQNPNVCKYSQTLGFLVKTECLKGDLFKEHQQLEDSVPFQGELKT